MCQFGLDGLVDLHVHALDDLHVDLHLLAELEQLPDHASEDISKNSGQRLWSSPHVPEK
jgi:hypothetical protein